MLKIIRNMEDKFKSFVTGNRDEFETYDLDLDLSWDEIADGIKQKAESEPKKGFAWMKIAAAVALLMIFSIVLIMFNRGGSSEENLIFASNPELAEAQAFYTSQIDHKMSIAKSKTGGEKMIEDIQELDKAFAELKNDLQDNADNEEVIIAMIENYQLKLKILDRVLEELQEDEQRAKEKEKVFQN